MIMFKDNNLEKKKKSSLYLNKKKSNKFLFSMKWKEIKQFFFLLNYLHPFRKQLEWFFFHWSMKRSQESIPWSTNSNSAKAQSRASVEWALTDRIFRSVIQWIGRRSGIMNKNTHTLLWLPTDRPTNWPTIQPTDRPTNQPT